MSYLFSGVPGFEVPRLVEYAFDCLAPGGSFMVHDFMVEDDRTGPIGLAAARTLPGNGEREGRLVVVGDADFGRNQFVSRVYNVDFFLNIANWLVHEEQFITIDRKRPRISLAEMTRTQVATFQYVSIFFLPEAILLLGVAIWWRRRS